MTQNQTNRKILVIATGEHAHGMAIAICLAGMGHHVMVAVSPGVQVAESVPVSCVTLDDQAADLDVAVNALFRGAEDIDTLILANCVPDEGVTVEHLDSEVWENSLRRNSTLAFLLSQASVPVLKRAREPRMIFILPEQVRGMPEPGRGAYLVAKATLIGLARTYALELGSIGILVNSVACEFPLLEPSSRVTRTASAPGNSDVAAAVSFFLSPATNFITGTTLDVNGGRSML